MEKKKNIWDINSLRTFFSRRKLDGSFLRRNTLAKLSPNGFTLIELLIVIALIGILAGGLVMVIDPMKQIQKAQDTKRKSDLGQIQKALETYYQDNGRYPASSVAPPAYRIKRLDDTIADWGQEFQPYMSILPKDPSSPAKNYVYFSNPSSNGQSYYLYANLDRSNDPQACDNPYQCLKSFLNISISACSMDVVCNYGASSSNVSI